MDKNQLRIVAPLNLPEEVDPLIEEGADELYCGFLPSTWLDRFSLAVPINRRDSGPGNIRSFDDLRHVVLEAHARKVPVYLALNAQTYTQDQVAFLRDYCRKVTEEADVDGFLVSDPGVMRLLAEWVPNKCIHVSSLAAVHNSMAVEFFKEMGAKRIILPRQITVKEVATIHRLVPEMELEVFILNDGCVLEEGLCSTTHGAGPFCLTEWQYRFQAVDGRSPLSGKDLENLQANQQDYRYWVLCNEASGRMTTPTGYPMGPCGLCAIPDFQQAGILALKVVGRESPTARKIVSVRITRKIRDLLIRGAAKDEIIAYTLELRQTYEACASGYYCYYPEVIRNWIRSLDGGKNALQRSSCVFGQSC